MKHNQQIQKNAAVHASGSSRQHKTSRFKRALKETWQFVKHPVVATTIGLTALSALSGAFTPASAQEKADRMFAANKPVPAATKENKNEAKQIAKIPVPTEVVLNNGFAIYVDFREADGKLQPFKVDVREQLAKAKGPITIEQANGATFFTADNGFFVLITPRNSTDRMEIIPIFGLDKKILSKYVNAENMMVVAVTEDQIAVNGRLGYGDVSFKDLKETTPVKDAKVDQNANDSNSAIVTGNGKLVAIVHTDAKTSEELVEVVSKAISMRTE